jgi:hypothetical protein
VPDVVIVKVYSIGGASENVAVTVTFEFIVTVQVPIPGQEPAEAGDTDHPVKFEPEFAFAVNITTLPAPKVKVEPELAAAVDMATPPAPKLRQLGPQARLEGDELTLIVPPPAPEVMVVKVYC